MQYGLLKKLLRALLKTHCLATTAVLKIFWKQAGKHKTGSKTNS